jgi:hypothetical protein
MEAFHPKKASFISRLLSHPALHISIIFVLVFIAVAYIRSQKQQTFLQQVAQMPKGPAVLKKSNSNELPNQVAEEPIAPESNQPPSSPENNEKNVVLTSLSSNLVNELTPVTQETKTATHTLKAIYTEVDKTILNRWVTNMQSIGQYFEADFKIGVLPQIQKELESDKSIVSYDSFEKKMDLTQQKIDWFTGKSTDGADLGFRQQMMATEIDRGVIKVELKIVRTIIATDPKSFELDIDLPPQSGLVIWGILPKSFSFSPEESLNPASFFQVFKSERYKNQRTEFTIVYLFDTPSPK